MLKEDYPTSCAHSVVLSLRRCSDLSKRGPKGVYLGSIEGLGSRGSDPSGPRRCIYYIYCRARVVAKWTNSKSKVLHLLPKMK